MSKKHQATICKNCGIDVAAPGRTLCYPCYGKARRSNIKPKDSSGLKVLFLDIETSPNAVYTWGFFKTNIGVEQVIEAGHILCFAAKWAGEDKVHFYKAHNYEPDRLEMLEAAWEMLNEADVVVHYYGANFDIPWLSREFMEHGMQPPRPFKQVDLKRVVARNFQFPSNKLQFVSTHLGLSGKVEHEGFSLWTKCMAGDPEAWKRMEEYNKQDVVLLEELLAIVLPWVDNFPNRNLYLGTGGCPKCGGEQIEEDGFSFTKLSKFRAYVCADCGSWFRGSKRISGVTIQEVQLTTQ